MKHDTFSLIIVYVFSHDVNSSTTCYSVKPEKGICRKPKRTFNGT